ncbi:uncharacterized protein GLRG_00114 [Colletotrichum graminicola M1.001]|uniref:Integral membrane protein n=1 Tax=Colletotrichum graminicola (strain M1.001 / M2 / FGSC 10212) TaxID=645133 RepID=E3Q2Z1_COLGM|nr:uncharacterized protein GLRG_00114 [Colletotrichum graminicola M1.001]EFQ24970.1 hypothetical protein GLRG_00114 [Colletotrichum graminicola M1.001]
MAEGAQMPGACVIEANLDATGTGIRASIYTLCLASGILKTIIQLTTSEKNYTEFCQAINSALQLQGLALLCTAVYQTLKGQLTLFHAICVLHLLSLLGFGLVAQRRYQGGGLNRWLVMAALRVIIACAFTTLTAYIWATAPTFGNQPDCNASTVYVVFGVSIRATNDIFRYVILALMASMAFGWVLSMVMYVVLAHCCCGGARSGMKWAKQNLISGQVVQLFIQTGINVYMIVTLEQIVKRNNLSKEEKEWTFGQILAIFVLLGVVVEVINILLLKLDGDLEGVPMQNEIELRPQENVGGRRLP